MLFPENRNQINAASLQHFFSFLLNSGEYLAFGSHQNSCSELTVSPCCSLETGFTFTLSLTFF